MKLMTDMAIVCLRCVVLQRCEFQNATVCSKCLVIIYTSKHSLASHVQYFPYVHRQSVVSF